MSVKLLFIVDEDIPTFRSDISVLFGKYMSQNCVNVDIIAGRNRFTKELDEWESGKKFLYRKYKNKIVMHFIAFSQIVAKLIFLDFNRYAAIQVRNMPLPATISLIIARIRKKKFYFWMSYPTSEGHIQRSYHKNRNSEGFFKFFLPWIRGNLGKLLLYKIVFPYSDHIFVQSDKMKKDMVMAGFPSYKLTSIPMGIDILENDILPIEDIRLKDYRVLVYLGTIDPVRKIEILFKMLAIIKNTIPNIMLLIVGDTHDKYHLDWLHEQSIYHGVNNNIQWNGWLPQQKALRYVKASEVGLSPFPRCNILDSASPTKILEYIAMGIPVVCNDNPDQSIIMDKAKAGFCVPYTAKNFAEAVLKILLQDGIKIKKEIDTIGKNFLSSTRSYEKIAKKLGDIYHHIT